MKGIYTAGLLVLGFASRALADTLIVDGFTNCNNGTSTINVNNVHIEFDRSTNKINFDVSGTSTKSQEVIAKLVVSFGGQQMYTNTFDPCDSSTKVAQLCPVPAGTFGAKGTQEIPSQYLSSIPSVIYTVPDLDVTAQIVLTAKDGSSVACVKSTVTNGKTLDLPAISYVAAAVAAAALAASLATAASSGTSSVYPGFFDVMFWFQSIAVNGMYSVNYPSLYRSFAKNFGFSAGLISWGGLQTNIDSFRARTGGNLTHASYSYLKNATLVYGDGTTAKTQSGFLKRSAELFTRQISTTVNSTTAGASDNTLTETVSGFTAYVEKLQIPEANTFMTVLLVFAIVVAAIVLGILLFKLFLELWALFGKFPKTLTTFRKEYWRVLAQTITSLILLFYGIWTLYCIFQFTRGDSWAAKVLAGVTWGLFTAVLAFYTWKVWSLARRLKLQEGNSDSLFNDKENWKKYKHLYENYKRGKWWLFMPVIIYLFARACIIAGAYGHGLIQTAGHLVLEAIMLVILIWSRPYNRRSGNIINIIIQVVRVLSVACILIFVEELGMAQTTKTVTGIVLVAVQAGLTGILAILIVANTIITCCKENPHRKARKAAEKAQRKDLESESFLMEPTHKVQALEQTHSVSDNQSMDSYEPMRQQAVTRYGPQRGDSQEVLTARAANMGYYNNGYQVVTHSDHGSPPPQNRQPMLPQFNFK